MSRDKAWAAALPLVGFVLAVTGSVTAAFGGSTTGAAAGVEDFLLPNDMINLNNVVIIATYITQKENSPYPLLGVSEFSFETLRHLFGQTGEQTT